MKSYSASQPGGEAQRCSLPYVWETGQLFLKTREALETNRPVTVQSFGQAVPVAQAG
jgi:hypothetical protein